MMGISFLLEGKSDSSRVYFVNAIKKSRLIKDKTLFIKSIVSYSNLEVDNIQNKNLLKLIYEALDEIEKSKKNQNQKAKLLMFLGEISFNNKEYKKAEEQYKEALNEGDKPLKNSIFRGLEAIHFYYKDYKKALSYAEKSLQEIKQVKSINYCVSLLRIGRNHLKLNQPKLALEYFLRSKKLQQEIGFNSLASETSIHLSEIARTNKNKIEELRHLKDAANISKESRNYFQLKEVYLKLYNYYSREEENYLEEQFFEKYTSLRDSLYNNEQNELKLNLDSKYSLGQKEIEIAHKDQLIKKEGTQKLIFIIASIILSICLLIIYFLFRKKNETERKLNETKLKVVLEKQKFEIIKTKIESKKAERQSISKELHDGIASNIVALKLMLSESNQQSKNIINNIDQLYDEIRGISHDLVPNYISKIEFTDLITDLSKKYSNDTIEVNSYFHKEEQINVLDENILFNIYRIIQECITNTIKHAEASEITITIILLQKELTVTIEDNGKGFEQKSQKNKGIGFKSIEHRINTLKGKHKINSSSNGVNIEFKIPINND